MERRYAERIVLIGPPGSGKTTLGALLAAALGWSFVDTDAQVAAVAGATLPELFAREGEARFRELESAALREACAGERVVIATGGGIGEREENLRLMRAGGWVVLVECAPETALARMRGACDDDEAEAIGARRPLLAGGDPLTQLQELIERRAGWYACHDDHVSTEDATPEEATVRILAGLIGVGALPPDGAMEYIREVRATPRSYVAVVAWGGLATLGARLAEMGFARRVFVVADATVWGLYGPAVEAALLAAGFGVEAHCVPPGEASKSREQLNLIHDWLVERRAERGEALVALGGGVVGDLAGFAAATYLRGVPLIQAPTSLLAQVDAAVGGKVAIDHPRGKNLIGAFYAPRLVLADPATLLTMPPRQRTEGWAEVIKHGVALDVDYFARLEREAEALLALRPAPTTEVIAGSVALKAGIVEDDEREREGGRRVLLNYGHTIAHAIESVAGYGAWLHGEAVAAGMTVAARVGRRIGITADEVVMRQDRLLARFGLPVRLNGLSAGELMRAALWDKKVRGGRVRWVLPTALGSAAIYDQVPDSDVRAALLEAGAVDDEPPPSL
ncbi:MAG: 3-dehydroquinate synthase [Ktedonobacterales bacterium]|jgi:3-dehydroquinate synthase|nr:MAG: 3-dehydroquinate synthase [Ktedonobacterales bacterium]